MIGTALCAPRNLCWVYAAAGLLLPSLPASATILSAANGARPRTYRSITWSWRRADDPAARLRVGLYPGNAAEFDPFLGQRLRFLRRGLAIDPARIDFAVMDAPRLLGKALANIIAILLDLLTHRHQHRAHLHGGDRRPIALARAADIRRHRRLFDLGVAAMRTGNPVSLLLRLKRVAVAEPRLEPVIGRAAQGAQDHRIRLLICLCSRNHRA